MGDLVQLRPGTKAPTHDVMCPLGTGFHEYEPGDDGCMCELIQRVRLNERIRIVADLHTYRVDTEALAGPGHEGYVNGLVRAEIIATGGQG